jgi:hypothetical protein
MGTTFQNLHALHGDHQAVWTAVQGAGGCPALFGRAPGEWCSLYPQDCREPRKLARAVSATLGAPVLVFDVYDSDSCEIALYNAGELVTRFANEYEDRPAASGDEVKFAKYAKNQDAAGIRAALDATPVFAEDIAIALAAYFDITRERVMFGFDWFNADAPERSGLALSMG